VAYKPTGRPPGRPKTKEYVTLLARVPADLAELVKRYAGERGQSVAALIKDGLEWRIGDGDPRGMGVYLAYPREQSEKVYSRNTEIAVSGESEALLKEIQAEQERQGAQLQAVIQALERQTVGEGTSLVAYNASNAHIAPSAVPVPHGKADKAMVVARIHAMHEEGLSSGQIAKALQEEGTATLSGSGSWQPGVVRKLLQAASA